MRLQPLALILSLLSLCSAAVIGKRTDYSNEIVYLSNCIDGNYLSSEMDYYVNSVTRKPQQWPDDQAYVYSNGYIIWEQSKPITGKFKNSHATFTVNGLVQRNPLAGSGKNSYGTKFACGGYQQEIPLFSKGSKHCYAIYACVHPDKV
jgi:hypothetical protein